MGRLDVAPAAAVGTPWDPTMELTINFELACIRGATKRPFVAAWIEDSNRFQVRTLAVWLHEDRWLVYQVWVAWIRRTCDATTATGLNFLPQMRNRPTYLLGLYSNDTVVFASTQRNLKNDCLL
jgi:hypothetical protein